MLMIVNLTHVNRAAPALTLLMITNVIVPALVLVEDIVNWVSYIIIKAALVYQVHDVLM